MKAQDKQDRGLHSRKPFFGDLYEFLRISKESGAAVSDKESQNRQSYNCILLSHINLKQMFSEIFIALPVNEGGLGQVRAVVM